MTTAPGGIPTTITTPPRYTPSPYLSRGDLRILVLMTPPTKDLLRSRLEHVRWIGGGSGAGKSTVARRLATAHGLKLYDCDLSISEHVARADATDAPLLRAFLAMDMDERWVNRSPEVMHATFHWFQGEGFDLIVEDLLALPDERPLLVEGFRLIPQLVAPLLSRPDQAVWLAPTPEFRRATFDSRGSIWDIPSNTTDPERALANLLAHDELFTEQLVREATGLGLTVIQVDVEMDIDDLTRRISNMLGLTTD